MEYCVMLYFIPLRMVNLDELNGNFNMTNFHYYAYVFMVSMGLCVCRLVELWYRGGGNSYVIFLFVLLN